MRLDGGDYKPTKKKKKKVDPVTAFNNAHKGKGKADGTKAFKQAAKATKKFLNTDMNAHNHKTKHSNSLGSAGLEPKKYHTSTTKKTTSKPKSNSLGQAGLDAAKYHAAVKKAVTKHSTPKKTTTHKTVTKPVATSHPTVSKHVVSTPKTVVAPKTVVPTHSVATQKPTSVPTTKAPVTPMASKPKPLTQAQLGLQSAQKHWFNDYSKQITTGTNNVKDLNRYNDYATNLKLTKSTVNEPTLHSLSIKALSGDANAQNYMKAMNLQGQTGSKLWQGYNPASLKQGTGLWNQYMKDNPTSETAKAYDMNTYNTYSKAIRNNQALSDDQMKSYQAAVGKWNLQDMTDPYNQMMAQNNDDRNAALKAQDKALNQSLVSTNATNFQTMQNTQQQMANRGMGASGIAADAYARATMASNQSIQQAYTDAATKKADIMNTYDQQGNKIANDQMAYYADRADSEAKAQSDTATAQAQLANAQTTQDKYLTSSTGYVYLNGKPLTMNGQPVTSLEYQKLSETQRHNIATENNISVGNQIKAQGVANNYALGQDKNAIAREKIGADLQTQMAKMKLEYSKLDFNYAKLDANNSIAQDKINLAQQNAQTSADKAKITSLGKQLSSLTSQITAYQKKGKKVPKDMVNKYNAVLKALNDVSGNFKTSGGGGEISKAPSGTPSAFGGYRRYGQQPAAFNGQMSQAISKGVPFAQAKLLTELIGRESGFRSSAKNPTSTAYGYGQFLTSTRKNYAAKYPNLNYNNPVDQIVLTWHYVQDRYGTAQKALEAWESRSPHWY